MPIYEYQCYRCGKEFQSIVLNKIEEEGIYCPECGGNNLKKLISQSIYHISEKDRGRIITKFTRLGMIGGFLGILTGGVLFTFIFPPVGGLIAAPLVLFASEYFRLQDSGAALEVMRGLLAGWGWAFVLRFGIGIVVMILWVIWTV